MHRNVEIGRLKWKPRNTTDPLQNIPPNRPREIKKLNKSKSDEMVDIMKDYVSFQKEHARSVAASVVPGFSPASTVTAPPFASPSVATARTEPTTVLVKIIRPDKMVNIVGQQEPEPFARTKPISLTNNQDGRIIAMLDKQFPEMFSVTDAWTEEIMKACRDEGDKAKTKDMFLVHVNHVTGTELCTLQKRTQWKKQFKTFYDHHIPNKEQPGVIDPVTFRLEIRDTAPTIVSSTLKSLFKY